MPWNAIASVVVAGMALYGFLRWLDRDRGDWRAEVEEHGEAASRDAQTALVRVNLLTDNIGSQLDAVRDGNAKLAEKVGLIEKQLVARRVG